MKIIFKLLALTLACTVANQSFGMLSRASRLAVKRAPAYQAVVLKPAHARMALGGLAALTGAGIALYDQPAKAEGAQENQHNLSAQNQSNVSILKPVIDEIAEKRIADLEKHIAEKKKKISGQEEELNTLKVELLDEHRKAKMSELQKLLAVAHSNKIDWHAQSTHVTLLEYLEGKSYNGYFFGLEGGFEGMLRLYKDAYPYLVGNRIEVLAREIVSLDSQRRALYPLPPFMPQIVNDWESYRGGR